MKKIYVIVVTYQGMKWYDKCFTSLRESTYPVRTIVVDNTPGEEGANYIQEHYPEIHLIKTTKNIGFGKGNNVGMRFALDAGCDYVFLLNQDAWVEPEMMGILVQVAEKYPEYGLLSPIHLKPLKNHLNMMLDDGMNNYELISDLYCHIDLQDVYPITYSNAAGWLLSRNALLDVGGFDPIFNHFGEDDNYLARLLFHKFEIGLCPKAVMVHADSDLLIPFSENDEHYRETVVDLITWTNITLPNSLERCLWKSLLKCISFCFRFNSKKRKYHWERYQRAKKYKDRVILSRQNNMERKPSWL